MELLLVFTIGLGIKFDKINEFAIVTTNILFNVKVHTWYETKKPDPASLHSTV